VSKHRGENLTAESRVVYVRNVPGLALEDGRMVTLLSRCGTVERCVTRRVPDAPRIANLIVSYATNEAARACVHECHGKSPFPECAVPLMAKMEEPQNLRDERLKTKPADHASHNRTAALSAPVQVSRRFRQDRAQPHPLRPASSAAAAEPQVSDDSSPTPTGAGSVTDLPAPQLAARTTTSPSAPQQNLHPSGGMFAPPNPTAAVAPMPWSMPYAPPMNGMLGQPPAAAIGPAMAPPFTVPPASMGPWPPGVPPLAPPLSGPTATAPPPVAPGYLPSGVPLPPPGAYGYPPYGRPW